jgi:hypothetical protein
LAIIVGGIHEVIDLAIEFIEFYMKQADILCQFEDYVPMLVEFVAASEGSFVIQNALHRRLLRYTRLLQWGASCVRGKRCERVETIVVVDNPTSALGAV